jgi:hypothetical protein
MNSTWNMPDGTNSHMLTPERCPDCGSNLGCDCFWDDESDGLTYRERVEYETNGD